MTNPKVTIDDTVHEFRTSREAKDYLVSLLEQHPSPSHIRQIENQLDRLNQSTTNTKGSPTMKTISQLREAIEAEPARSAWSKAVNVYALELLEELPAEQEFYGSPADKKVLLNGADDWQQYSEGGCSLIYDGDIAERLCSPSEYKRTQEGQNPPNARESWIETQARALYQAARLICRLAKE